MGLVLVSGGGLRDSEGNTETRRARSGVWDEDYPVYGARPLKRVIQQRVQNELANAMLEGRFGEGATVKVDATADGFLFGAGCGDPEGHHGDTGGTERGSGDRKMVGRKMGAGGLSQVTRRRGGRGADGVWSAL